jgi:glucosamine--fructose-6-phosphate aminotransferase (isomerizing)
MCGIFGYRGERADAAAIVLAGLKALEYRGYDSWGVAVARGDVAAVERRVGKIGRATTDLPPSHAGIGHTRWATHGAVTEANAHPHLDCGGRLAVVHNGIVANDVALRASLARSGHRFRSETDTELIAHLVEEALAADDSGGNDALLRATLAAFRRLEGLNAVAVLDVRSGAIAAAKSGTPIVVGHGVGATFLASDATALLPHTRRVTFVRDGQAVLLGRAGVHVVDIASGCQAEEAPEIVAIEGTAESADRGVHPDFMSKEMQEQPAVLARLAALPDRAMRLAEAIAASREVFVVGCGSAAHAAMAAQHLLRGCGRRVTAAPAFEFGHLLPLMGPGVLVIALSQSGETIDVLDAARAARDAGATIAAVTNVEGSSLTRASHLVVPLDAGPERCVLATKSLIAKLAVLLLAAHAVEGRWDAGASLVRRAAADASLMLEGPRRETLRSIARAIGSCENLYVLGRGPSHALALETALKIKEVSYVHAEGFAGGELKHGVMALVEPGTPCVVIAPDDETHADTMAGARQVKARGAVVIGVSPRPHEAFDHHVEVADLGPATAIVNAVPAQILGYELARLRGHDPDMPRNLAKSVTVR